MIATTNPAGSTLGTLTRAVTQFTALDRDPGPEYMEAVGAVAGLCRAIGEAERAGLPREAILHELAAARRVLARGGFIRRLQQWPRGYPGDFETIDMLLDAPNTTRPGTLEHQCERYAYTCGAAQQYRNKVQWQSRAIVDVAMNRGRRGRVLILACGGARDVLQVASLLQALGCPEIVLNDADPDALETAATRLAAISDRIVLRPGNALQVTRSAEIGDFDLVLMGGLLDYLADRQADVLVRLAKRRLRPDGVLRMTNIARGNPYRIWISYLGDWHLIERDVADLRAVAGPGRTRIARDTTGLSLLAEVRAQP